MPLEKILIVNDDSEDILAMQARLPEQCNVQAASQFQARYLSDFSGYNLIILDNDANNLQDSKGKETLQAIKKRNPSVPVFYTSFQPGWVPGEVYQTRDTRVVRTDQLLDTISKEFGIELKDVEESEKPESQQSLILTYNPVEGYNPGLHSDKLLIVSYDKYASGRAKEVLTQEIQKIYENFNWRTDRDLIRNIFVYDGVNGGDLPGSAAQSLGHDVRMRVHLMACRCDWERKERLFGSTYVDLHKVECGGRESLGAVADTILGIQRPGVDYNGLSIPLEKITVEAEKFRM
jgi:CheY-like chemotaxis protein